MQNRKQKIVSIAKQRGRKEFCSICSTTFIGQTYIFDIRK